MKATAIAMGVILAALMLIALYQGFGVFKDGMSTSAKQFGALLPILVIAILLTGFAETLLPKNIVETWLSDAAGWKGIVIAWMAGVITPGGSIVGLPIVAGLFKAGVGTAVLMTYTSSLALLSFLRLPLEAGFYGWNLTVLRVVVSLFLPLIAGGLTLLLTRIWQP